VSSADAVVIGGGIIGTAAAALLAEAGLSVTLVEERALAAGASGRNSGSLQHPFEPVFNRLHAASLAMYRELSELEGGFRLPAAPSGLLLVSRQRQPLAAAEAHLNELAPELSPQLLEPTALRDREPALGGELWALALETGYPVVPAAATLAYAQRAARAGADIIVGSAARPIIRAGRIAGARLDTGEVIDCAKLLVAAGPWTPGLLPGWADESPIVATWGLVVSVRLAHPPTAILEETGIDARGSAEPISFSLVTTDGLSSVGSTFLPAAPEPDEMSATVMRRAARFVPALSDAPVDSVRICARPVSRDGLPFVGPVGSADGLFVCAGHGPWGISTGPASAKLAVDLMLGRRAGLEDLVARLSPDRQVVPA
jgi:glycine/D-amino acid oxidase-like deaminating enzyme